MSAENEPEPAASAEPTTSERVSGSRTHRGAFAPITKKQVDKEEQPDEFKTADEKSSYRTASEEKLGEKSCDQKDASKKRVDEGSFYRKIASDEKVDGKSSYRKVTSEEREGEREKKGSIESVPLIYRHGNERPVGRDGRSTVKKRAAVYHDDGQTGYPT
ncbi:hypothetical protein Y032_0015g2882 [Ancylostoma ceylanicum]|uniref:Uncharacterized protein n=1 Tax=Ancylostoma ceylanicum TaxID=53326 RepID=A0A016VAV9_9BILA|nr:hypothetical protein Y032_0015g2882 [Ancylostoma ceylanicum]